MQNNLCNGPYDGAGVLILQVHNNRLSVILFRNQESGKYHDIGGYINPEDMFMQHPLSLCACREAEEESCGLFKFNLDSHPTYIDLARTSTGKYYRCYLVLIPSYLDIIDSYHYNHTVVSTLDLKKDWYETNGINRFYLDDIFTAVQEMIGSNLTCINSSDLKQEIMPRTAVFLRYIYNNQKLLQELEFRDVNLIRVNNLITYVLK